MGSRDLDATTSSYPAHCFRYLELLEPQRAMGIVVTENPSQSQEQRLFLTAKESHHRIADQFPLLYPAPLLLSGALLSSSHSISYRY
jgi:hypothetical protein